MAHQVTLQWQPTGDPGVTYNIFRGTQAGKENALPLNPTPQTGTTFTDDTVTPGEYFYNVDAVINGVSSPASNEVSVVILPAAPTGLVVVSSN